MSDLPASHYLEIYRHRVSMAMRDITKPSPEVLDASRHLVAQLEQLDPSERIYLEEVDRRLNFHVRRTGKMLGGYELGPKK